MIIRGTTPLLVFTINSAIDLNDMVACRVTVRINPKNTNKKDFTYELNKMAVLPDDHVIELRLEQADTIQFSSQTCQIQMRLKLADGRAYASPIIEEDVEPVLNTGVI